MSLVWDKQKAREYFRQLWMQLVLWLQWITIIWLTWVTIPKNSALLRCPKALFVMQSQKYKRSKLTQHRELQIWAHSRATYRAMPLCLLQLSLLTCGETGAAQKEPTTLHLLQPSPSPPKTWPSSACHRSRWSGKTRTLASTWLCFSLIRSI